MSLKTVFYAYIIGGLTFIPLAIACFLFYAFYTSIPVADGQQTKFSSKEGEEPPEKGPAGADDSDAPIPVETYDVPRTRKGWLTVRRTFEASPDGTGYVNMMRSFLDARTKDPKRLRPKDTWYVVLKGTVLYLYEDEEMTECEAAVELSGHEVIVYPESLLDGELFARRNAICLRPRLPLPTKYMPSVTREMKLEKEDQGGKLDQGGGSPMRKEKEREKALDVEKKKDVAGDEALNVATPWFIFVRSNTEMEDWYLALIHASEHPAQTPTLEPLQPVFEPIDMDYLVATLDEQPDVIPMRWFNALIGRIFFSYYRTHTLEAFIIGRLMKKLSKVKRPAFLSDIVVKEVSVGNRAPTFSKPMLKELTKEGDASMEVHARYKGEVRITVEATATINLSTRLKPYNVKLVLAAILREIEGNMLIKMKRPPSNRIWYAFTQMPKIVLDVEPVVSDRQITWGMILSTIESRLKEIIQESIVMPNMDDIAFFESSKYKNRGGIWADASRTENREALSSKYRVPSNVDGENAQDATPESQNDSRAEVESLNQGMGGPSAPPDIQTTPAGAGEVPTFKDFLRRSSLSAPNTRSEDPAIPVGRPFEDDESQSIHGPAERGRTSWHEPGTSTSTRSSRSRDEKVPSDLDRSEENVHSFLSPHGLRPSSSRHSLNNDRTLTGSPDSMGAVVVERSAALLHRRVSDAASITSVSASPPGTSSFLSTLRSKDKQAIKDSAKEAIRKLGVNWGLKREWTMTPNSEPVLDHSQPAKDGPASVSRGSYAEVRAAVAERKEREKTTLTNTTTHPVPTDTSSDTPNTITTEDGDLGSLLAPSTPPSGDVGPGQKRSPSRGRTVTELDDLAVESHQHTPIFVQPQGKTMTIPGIHASHRGEIMALGYVAPSMGQTDTRNKNNPTINSLYRRLMKSPVLSHQENSQAPDDGAAQNSENMDSNEEVPSLVLTPQTITPEPQPRPVPPPLPPRTKAATQALVPETPKLTEPLNNPTRESEERLESSDRVPLVDEEGLSVSETEMNEHLPIKASQTSGPPPLPPRRLQTSA